MQHKKQHWVPRSYLDAWTDPDTPDGQHPYVWRFPRDGGPGERKAPKNIFHETDMYTITCADGSRDLSLEHGLAGLEDQFATIRREKLEDRQEIEYRERLLVCAFVAAMQARTLKQRDHFRALWLGVEEDMAALMEAVEKTPPEERKRKFATTPRQHPCCYPQPGRSPYSCSSRALVENAHLALAELLLSGGADANAIAADGATPLALARLDPEMEALMRRHGGR